MKKNYFYIGLLAIISALGAQDKHAYEFTPSLAKLSYDIEELNPINVLHYNINLTLDMEQKAIDGHVRLDIELLDTTATSFFLHLTTPQIVSALLNGQNIPFTHTSDKVYFSLPAPTSNITLDIQYGGTPGNDGFGGFFFQDNYAFTIGEGLNSATPSMLRHWVPSFDVPYDKATMDMRLTVPSALGAFSNGSFISTTSTSSTKTIHWQEKHPIATYLMAIAVGNYAVLHSSYQSVTGDSIPLEFYVFPSHLSAAENDWKNLPNMLRFFENNFAPYPFDRYSMAEAYNRGAMEHQTMTTYSYQLVTGDNRYDYIVAHELAHHWWGDLVTLGDWRDIWLNEGFATYSEALYFESLYGSDYLADYMNSLLEIYLAEVSRRGHFPIYDPAYMWGGTIYQKGAWVLHMLRWTVGEEAFWSTLQKWADRFAYDNAVTLDFIDLAEEVSQQDLNWFFDQWIYQAGYPDFDISWDYKANDDHTYSVTVDIKQQQWQTYQFRAPIEILFETGDGMVLDTLVSSSEYQSFQIAMHEKPISMSVDPHNWLLKQYDLISNPPPPGVNPNDFYLAQNYPNPFKSGSQTSIIYQVAQQGSPFPVTLKIFNILGQEVKTIVDRQQHGGFYKTVWDGKDMAGRTVPSGVYFYRLQSENEIIEKKLIIFER